MEFDMKMYFTDTVFPQYAETLKSSSAKKNYEYALNEFFDKFPLYEHYTYDNCCFYFDYLEHEKNLNYSTCVKKRRQLSSIFDFPLKKRPKFPELPTYFENFFKQIPLCEEKQTIKANRVLSLGELDKLISYTKENDMVTMLGIMFSFKMMMRISEFMKIKWSDIVISENTYVLKIPTLAGYRYEDLPIDVFEHLDLYRNNLLVKTTYVFSGIKVLAQGKGKDKPFADRTLEKRLSDACVNADIPHYTFNDLRNAGIAYAASQGASVHVIADTINLRTVSHYSRLTSLDSLTFPNAGNYTNVVFTGKSYSYEDTVDGEIDPKKVIQVSFGSWCVTSLRNILSHKLYEAEDVENAFNNAHSRIRWLTDIFSVLDANTGKGCAIKDRFYDCCLDQFKEINHCLTNAGRETLEELFEKDSNYLLEKACFHIGKDGMKELMLQNAFERQGEEGDDDN